MDEQRLDDLAVDGFGYWLAGFVDGEGTFNINYLPKQDTYQCRFGIIVRDDDLPVLETIQRRVGLGTISFMGHYAKPNANPQARWGVYSRRDCYALVRVFDRFPLLAKKQKDYAIWREAVSEWTTHLGRGNHGRVPEFKAALESARCYPAGRTRPAATPDLQLALS